MVYHRALRFLCTELPVPSLQCCLLRSYQWGFWDPLLKHWTLHEHLLKSVGLDGPVWIPELIYCFWEKQWCLLLCMNWWNMTFKTTFALQTPAGILFLNSSLMVKNFPISSPNIHGQSYANVILQVKKSLPLPGLAQQLQFQSTITYPFNFCSARLGKPSSFGLLIYLKLKLWWYTPHHPIMLLQADRKFEKRTCQNRLHWAILKFIIVPNLEVSRTEKKNQ